MAKNKKNSVSTILLRVAAIILLLVGIALIFNKQISDQLIHHNQQSTLSGINRKTIEENKKKKGVYDFSNVIKLRH